jgi:hypothetical protein
MDDAPFSRLQRKNGFLDPPKIGGGAGLPKKRPGFYEIAVFPAKGTSCAPRLRESL